MESKRKKRQVHKVSSVKADKPTSAEKLIRFNGDLIEELFNSQSWKEIAFPLLEESIAGVCGRLTNGRYHHGSLTRDLANSNSLFVAGYQKALMDFNNNLLDFIEARDKLKEQKKESIKEKNAPLYNPFLED